MGDKPKPSEATSKTDARNAEQQGPHNRTSSKAKPAVSEDGKPFPNPAKNTDAPEKHPPEQAIKRRYPEPTD